MSDLIGNLEDRFSHDGVHLISRPILSIHTTVVVHTFISDVVSCGICTIGISSSVRTLSVTGSTLVVVCVGVISSNTDVIWSNMLISVSSRVLLGSLGSNSSPSVDKY